MKSKRARGSQKNKKTTKFKKYCSPNNSNSHSSNLLVSQKRH